MADTTSGTEVARYVVGYLLQNNYSQTLQVFLQECKQLNGATITVLPSTPLKEIIAEHITRKSASQMVDSLGSMSSWRVLWQQLQHTLTQINTLAEDVISDPQRSRPTAGKNRSRRTSNLHKPPLVFSHPSSPLAQSSISRQPQIPSSSSSSSSSYTTTTTTTSSFVNPSTPTASGAVVDVTTDNVSLKTRSPRKSKRPKRTLCLQPEGNSNQPPIPPLQTLSVPLTTVDPSSSLPPDPSSIPADIQNILGALLSNEALPERLAELINQYSATDPTSCLEPPVTVSNSEQPQSHSSDQFPAGPPLLSQTTLDSILDVTCTDSWLEDLLASNSSPPNLPSLPVSSHPLPSQISVQQSAAPVSSVATGSGIDLSKSVSTADQTRKRPRSVEEEGRDISCSKLQFPPGMNVEAFLDKLHNK